MATKIVKDFYDDQKYHKTHNIKYLYPVLRLLKIFALYPPLDFNLEIQRQHPNVPYYYKIYTIFVSGFIISISLYSCIGRVNNQYAQTNVTQIIADMGQQICMILFAISTILGSAFWCSDHYRDVVWKLHQVETIKTFKNSHIYLIDLLFAMISYVIINGIDLSYWLKNMDLHVFSFFLFERFQLALLMMDVVVMLNIVLCISYRFEMLSNILSEKCKIGYVGAEELKCYQESFVMLSEAVDDFNGAFGWPISFLYLIIVFVSVGVVDGSLLNSSAELLVSCIMWCFMFLLFGILLAAACQSAQQQAKNLGDYAYQLLAKIPKSPTTYYTRKNLQLLAQQVTNRCPYFTAAGFFKIDYTVLLTTIGTFTSYIIVIIQLNK